MKEPVIHAMQPGKVPMVAPSVWGSNKHPGGSIPHPAPVLSNHGGVATVAQLTHRPIAGQKVIETGHIAPSVGQPDKHGRKSYIDLNTHNVDTHKLQAQGHKPMKVLGTSVPQHERDNIKAAVHTVPFKINAGKHAAAVGGYKTNSRTAAQHAAAAGLHKSNLRGAAHAAAAAANARKARLGHHY